MTYTERTIEGLPVFELEGKMMGDKNCETLCDRLKELANAGQKHVVLDCEKVQWINSAGIGFVLSCVATLRRNGGDLHFIGAHGKVAHYFTITRLNGVLSIYPDRNTVIEELKAKGLIPVVTA